MKRYCTTIFLIIFGFLSSNAQQKIAGKLEFDSITHDFGQVLLSEGPVKCTFKFKNISSSPIAIYSVTTSCGCTSVKWSRKPLLPGESGDISATYTNDEGPYPFDKTLTVQFAGISKPVLLHLRGTSCEKKLSDEVVYNKVFCKSIGLSEESFRTSNLEQGGMGTQQTTIANLTKRPVSVSFEDVTDGLQVILDKNPIPAKSHATATFIVESREGKWGTNEYFATPVVGGVKADRTIAVTAFTTVSYSTLTKEEKANHSIPYFKEGTYSFNHVKQGAKLKATFKCENKGKEALQIMSCESDHPSQVSLPSSFPAIQPGKMGTYSFEVDTKTLPLGEALLIVTLTTNSPTRPIVNLFIVGWVD